MFKIFGKKKLKEDALANIFINAIVEVIDNGFDEVAGLINDAPEFLSTPQVSTEDNSKFTLIVIAANLKEIPNHFEAHQDSRLIISIVQKLSNLYKTDYKQLESSLRNYQSYLSTVNHPSRNTVYAMSKALFYKYELGPFQEEHFKKLNAPNPLFLKRMDKVMEMFLFDWEEIKENFQIVS